MREITVIVLPQKTLLIGNKETVFILWHFTLIIFAIN
jgi:hypothetical protein